MQDLPIKRDLSNDEYRLGETHMGGIFVSVYRTPTEVIVADAYDPTKIYQVTSAEFHDKIFAE